MAGEACLVGCLLSMVFCFGTVPVGFFGAAAVAAAVAAAGGDVFVRTLPATAPGLMPGTISFDGLFCRSSNRAAASTDGFELSGSCLFFG